MLKVFLKVGCLLLLLCLSTDKSTGLSLESILQISTFEQLQKKKANSLLKILCEKEKKDKTIPLSCYKSSKDHEEIDFWCLNLKISHLKVKPIKKALRTGVLSQSCEKHLQKKLKILIYRKKDFLLPELKNHWTEESLFL